MQLNCPFAGLLKYTKYTMKINQKSPCTERFPTHARFATIARSVSYENRATIGIARVARARAASATILTTVMVRVNIVYHNTAEDSI